MSQVSVSPVASHCLHHCLPTATAAPSAWSTPPPPHALPLNLRPIPAPFLRDPTVDWNVPWPCSALHSLSSRPHLPRLPSWPPFPLASERRPHVQRWGCWARPHLPRLPSWPPFPLASERRPHVQRWGCWARPHLPRLRASLRTNWMRTPRPVTKLTSRGAQHCEAAGCSSVSSSCSPVSGAAVHD